jgi:putative transcriptional regulator
MTPPNEDTHPAEAAKTINRVRRLRRARGLTQADFGDLLGVSRQTVNAIENGRYDPSLRLAFDIARVFAARIEDVFHPSDAVTAWSNIMIAIPDGLDADTVRVRPHIPSDLPAFEQFLADDEAVRFMAFTPDQRSPAGAAAMMDAVIGSYASDQPICSLTIADPVTNQYLGSVGGADAGDGAMEVFVTVLPEAQGKGYGTAAMSALIEHLFTTSGVEELRADVVEQNQASVRLFEALGFRRLGPVQRAAEEGVLAHREMTGIRYVLTRQTHARARSRSR